jgi:hypothetical protein
LLQDRAFKTAKLFEKVHSRKRRSSVADGSIQLSYINYEQKNNHIRIKQFNHGDGDVPLAALYVILRKGIIVLVQIPHVLLPRIMKYPFLPQEDPQLLRIIHSCFSVCPTIVMA